MNKCCRSTSEGLVKAAFAWVIATVVVLLVVLAATEAAAAA